MFEVLSYVSKDGKWFRENYFKEQFFPFDSEKSEVYIKKIINNDSRMYGFVNVLFNGSSILGYNEYGSLENLWSMYYGLVVDYIINGESAAEFPDYELEIQILPVDNSSVLLKIGTIKEYILPKIEFLQALINGAISFYSTLLLFTNDSDTEIFINILRMKLDEIQ
ncbi:hypothetical protein ACOI1C_11630 [Bacillus sp. DJP31]|uniref:hypothetical protein n=1 Tax=Bacillus sp. DJP31 TaxID=3409789 RepID=UPI003BB695FC